MALSLYCARSLGSTLWSKLPDTAWRLLVTFSSGYLVFICILFAWFAALIFTVCGKKNSHLEPASGP